MRENSDGFLQEQGHNATNFYVRKLDNGNLSKMQAGDKILG
jgi:hypothetical protein